MFILRVILQYTKQQQRKRVRLGCVWSCCSQNVKRQPAKFFSTTRKLSEHSKTSANSRIYDTCGLDHCISNPVSVTKSVTKCVSKFRLFFWTADACQVSLEVLTAGRTNQHEGNTENTVVQYNLKQLETIQSEYKVLLAFQVAASASRLLPIG